MYENEYNLEFSADLGDSSIGQTYGIDLSNLKDLDQKVLEEIIG